MKTTNFIFLTVLTYLLGISNLAALPKEISKISGKVEDQSGQAVRYANVALISVKGGLVDGAVSDENGSFMIESVKAAKVKVYFADIDTSFRQYRRNQEIRFTLRYNFAKGESLRVKCSTGSSEERNRLD